ncbi:MAG: hypothetical protein NUV91_07215, partial [Candidatus Omnitrophica bacterium]|nr:hypothetical protein [Candidatus Omnitrophota bacterium]
PCISLSAPRVAATIARVAEIMRERRPGSTVRDVLEFVRGAARPMPDDEYFAAGLLGAGFVDPAAVIAKAREMPQTETPERGPDEAMLVGVSEDGHTSGTGKEVILIDDDVFSSLNFSHVRQNVLREILSDPQLQADVRRGLGIQGPAKIVSVTKGGERGEMKDVHKVVVEVQGKEAPVAFALNLHREWVEGGDVDRSFEFAKAEVKSSEVLPARLAKHFWGAYPRTQFPESDEDDAGWIQNSSVSVGEWIDGQNSLSLLRSLPREERLRYIERTTDLVARIWVESGGYMPVDLNIESFVQQADGTVKLVDVHQLIRRGLQDFLNHAWRVIGRRLSNGEYLYHLFNLEPNQALNLVAESIVRALEESGRLEEAREQLREIPGYLNNPLTQEVQRRLSEITPTMGAQKSLGAAEGVSREAWEALNPRRLEPDEITALVEGLVPGQQAETKAFQDMFPGFVGNDLAIIRQALVLGRVPVDQIREILGETAASRAPPIREIVVYQVTQAPLDADGLPQGASSFVDGDILHIYLVAGNAVGAAHEIDEHVVLPALGVPENQRHTLAVLAETAFSDGMVTARARNQIIQMVASGAIDQFIAQYESGQVIQTIEEKFAGRDPQTSARREYALAHAKALYGYARLADVRGQLVDSQGRTFDDFLQATFIPKGYLDPRLWVVEADEQELFDQYLRMSPQEFGAVLRSLLKKYFPGAVRSGTLNADWDDQKLLQALLDYFSIDSLDLSNIEDIFVKAIMRLRFTRADIREAKRMIAAGKDIENEQRILEGSQVRLPGLIAQKNFLHVLILKWSRRPGPSPSGLAMGEADQGTGAGAPSRQAPIRGHATGDQAKAAAGVQLQSGPAWLGDLVSQDSAEIRRTIFGAEIEDWLSNLPARGDSGRRIAAGKRILADQEFINAMSSPDAEIGIEVIRYAVRNQLDLGTKSLVVLVGELRKLAPENLRRKIKETPLPIDMYVELMTILGHQQVQDYLQGEMMEIPAEDRLVGLVDKMIETGLNLRSENLGQIYSALPSELGRGIRKRDVKHVNLRWEVFQQVREALKDEEVQRYVRGKLPKTYASVRIFIAEVKRRGLPLDTTNALGVYTALPAEWKSYFAEPRPEAAQKSIDADEGVSREVWEELDPQEAHIMERLSFTHQLRLGSQAQTPEFQAAIPDFEKHLELVKKIIRFPDRAGELVREVLGDGADPRGPPVEKVIIYFVDQPPKDKNGLLQGAGSFPVEDTLHIYVLNDNPTGAFHEIYEQVVLPALGVPQHLRHTLTTLAETAFGDSIVSGRAHTQIAQMQTLGILDRFIANYDEIVRQINEEKFPGNDGENHARRKYALDHALALHELALGSVRSDQREDYGDEAMLVDSVDSVDSGDGEAAVVPEGPRAVWLAGREAETLPEARQNIFGQGIDDWLAALESRKYPAGQGTQSIRVQAAQAILDDAEFQQAIKNPDAEIAIEIIRSAVRNNLDLGTQSFQSFTNVFRDQAPQLRIRLRTINLSVQKYVKLISSLALQSTQIYLRSPAFRRFSNPPTRLRRLKTFMSKQGESFLRAQPSGDVISALPEYLSADISRTYLGGQPRSPGSGTSDEAILISSDGEPAASSNTPDDIGKPDQRLSPKRVLEVEAEMAAWIGSDHQREMVDARLSGDRIQHFVFNPVSQRFERTRSVKTLQDKQLVYFGGDAEVILIEDMHADERLVTKKIVTCVGCGFDAETPRGRLKGIVHLVTPWDKAPLEKVRPQIQALLEILPKDIMRLRVISDYAQETGEDPWSRRQMIEELSTEIRKAFPFVEFIYQPTRDTAHYRSGIMVAPDAWGILTGYEQPPSQQEKTVGAWQSEDREVISSIDKPARERATPSAAFIGKWRVDGEIHRQGNRFWFMARALDAPSTSEPQRIELEILDDKQTSTTEVLAKMAFAYRRDVPLMGEMVDWFAQNPREVLIIRNNDFGIPEMTGRYRGEDGELHEFMTVAEAFENEGLVYLHGVGEAMVDAGILRVIEGEDLFLELSRPEKTVRAQIKDSGWYHRHMSKPDREGMEGHYGLRALFREVYPREDRGLRLQIKGKLSDQEMIQYIRSQDSSLQIMPVIRRFEMEREFVQTSDEETRLLARLIAEQRFDQDQEIALRRSEDQRRAQNIQERQVRDTIREKIERSREEFDLGRKEDAQRILITIPSAIVDPQWIAQEVVTFLRDQQPLRTRRESRDVFSLLLFDTLVQQSPKFKVQMLIEINRQVMLEALPLEKRKYLAGMLNDLLRAIYILPERLALTRQEVSTISLSWLQHLPLRPFIRRIQIQDMPELEAFFEPYPGDESLLYFRQHQQSEVEA